MTFQHGSSIHHAGFLDPKTIYGLSDDHKLSFYPFTDWGDERVDDRTETHFEDLNTHLGCDYAIDLVREASTGTTYLAMGANKYV